MNQIFGNPSFMCFYIFGFEEGARVCYCTAASSTWMINTTARYNSRYEYVMVGVSADSCYSTGTMSQYSHTWMLRSLLTSKYSGLDLVRDRPSGLGSMIWLWGYMQGLITITLHYDNRKLGHVRFGLYWLFEKGNSKTVTVYVWEEST